MRHPCQTKCYSFEIEEATPPRQTSTPIERGRQALSSIRRALYNRRLTQQVPVEDPLFFSRPSKLVRFQFDNPTFEEEVTQIFERDLESVEEPPDRQFLDVAKLGRPLYSETPQGYIRVSRLGNRASLRTRSGAQVGAQVHFYKDVSTIDSEAPIELQLLGEHSGDTSIIQGPVESTLVDINVRDTPELLESSEFNSQDLLIDDAIEDFSGSQLVFGNPRRSTTSVTVPRFSSPRETTLYVQDIQGYTVAYPESRDRPVIIYPQPEIPAVVIHFGESGADYYLHPHLQRRKRKRAYL